MDITKIGHGENPDAVKAIIEVPLNSAIKYEIDKDSGAVEVDRVLYSAMHYPANYGFVANTLSRQTPTKCKFSNASSHLSPN